MSRKLKELIQKEYHERFEGVDELLVVSLRGIGGVDNNLMRGELLKDGIHICVVKNSLAARMFAEAGKELGALLSGPCAIAYGGDNIVDLAKAMVEWEKKLDSFEIKGGFLEGSILDAEEARALAKMPNRVELQGILVAMALSPGSRIAGAVGAPAGYIAGCIKALVEKLEDEAA